MKTIYKVYPDGTDSGSDRHGRPFVFVTNAEVAKIPTYKAAIESWADPFHAFGISDVAYNLDGEPVPGLFGLFVLANTHLDREEFINHYLAVEDQLSKK
jgi:hypothetical protein